MTTTVNLGENSRRFLILEAIKNRLADAYGPDGDSEPILRSVSLGPWTPLKGNAPAAWVFCDGQQLGGRDENDTVAMEMSPQLVIEAKGAWNREEDYRDWLNRIEGIITLIQHFEALPSVLACDYVRDTPVTIEFQNGETTDVWSIEFLVRYHQYVGTFPKT